MNKKFKDNLLVIANNAKKVIDPKAFDMYASRLTNMPKDYKYLEDDIDDNEMLQEERPGKMIDVDEKKYLTKPDPKNGDTGDLEAWLLFIPGFEPIKEDFRTEDSEFGRYKKGDFNTGGYLHRLFPDIFKRHLNYYNWIFDTLWTDVDNTIDGAVQRILYVLEHESVPDNFMDQIWGKAKITYKENQADCCVCNNHKHIREVK